MSKEFESERNCCINCSADLTSDENKSASASAFFTLSCSSRIRSPVSPATVELIPVHHALSTIFNFDTLDKMSKVSVSHSRNGIDPDNLINNDNNNPIKDFQSCAPTVPICFVCYLVLSDLYKIYTEFSQLRKANSLLGSKLIALENLLNKQNQNQQSTATINPSTSSSSSSSSSSHRIRSTSSTTNNANTNNSLQKQKLKTSSLDKPSIVAGLKLPLDLELKEFELSQEENLAQYPPGNVVKLEVYPEMGLELENNDIVLEDVRLGPLEGNHFRSSQLSSDNSNETYIASISTSTSADVNPLDWQTEYHPEPEPNCHSHSQSQSQSQEGHFYANAATKHGSALMKMPHSIRIRDRDRNFYRSGSRSRSRPSERDRDRDRSELPLGTGTGPCPCGDPRDHVPFYQCEGTHCAHCNKDFKQKYNLRNHVRGLLKIGLIKCHIPGCSFECLLKHDLQRHLNTKKHSQIHILDS